MQLRLTLRTPVVLFALATDAAVAADGPAGDAPPESGQRLFEEHGCTNCHGADGVHPESKYMPILRGKSTDYLYQQATVSLRPVASAGASPLGVRSRVESRRSPRQRVELCTLPPDLNVESNIESKTTNVFL